jgi:Raf kinase inhibitor-like YbhB/YbcL family protein
LSFAVICHDPDAPLVAGGLYGVVHWVLYNIPGEVRSLNTGNSSYKLGTRTGGNQTYGGPMPPPGHGPHRCFFWVIALNSEPNIQPGLTMSQFLTQMESNIIGMNRLVGTYVRNPQ